MDECLTYLDRRNRQTFVKLNQEILESIMNASDFDQTKSWVLESPSAHASLKAMVEYLRFDCSVEDLSVDDVNDAFKEFKRMTDQGQQSSNWTHIDAIFRGAAKENRSIQR